MDKMISLNKIGVLVLRIVVVIIVSLGLFYELKVHENLISSFFGL